VRPVLEDVERLAHDRRRIGGDLEHVDGLVERRVGVQVRPEAHAGALEEVHEVGLREAARAVEGHVLDEVRDAELRLVFEDRPGVDDEAELGALLGERVAPDQIAKAVRQAPAAHGAVERKRSVGGLGPRLGARLGRGQGAEEHERDEQRGAQRHGIGRKAEGWVAGQQFSIGAPSTQGAE
jgi:hypothetical protein